MIFFFKKLPGVNYPYYEKKFMSLIKFNLFNLLRGKFRDLRNSKIERQIDLIMTKKKLGIGQKWNLIIIF